MSNAPQIEHWAGPTGQRWAEYQEVMDQSLGPLGELALRAADVLPGEHVLDVGCGCGDTTLALAGLVGDSGLVTGIDVSAPMLAVARERCASVGQVMLVEADASVADLPMVDLVFSRFGVMFFAEPAVAFSHLRACLRKNGRLAFVCWRSPPENDWVKVPLEAISPHVPAEPAPDPFAPGPFAFSSRSRIEQILDEAGFGDVVVEPFDRVMYWTRSSELDVGVDFLSKMGPASRRLNDVSDEVRERALLGLRQALRPYQQGDGLALGAAIWVVTARAR